MELSEEKIREYTKRLLKSRMRILCNHGFYGLLLMHIVFSLDEDIDTAATNGTKIMFSPGFLDEISDKELDFVLMHEILHIVLQHCVRGAKFESEQFNIACDIVVNSNILKSNNMDFTSITLKKYGELMHKTPDGKEGYEYTAEEIYDMLNVLLSKAKSKNKIQKSKNKSSLDIDSADSDGNNNGKSINIGDSDKGDDGNGDENSKSGRIKSKGKSTTTGKGFKSGRASKEKTEVGNISGQWDDHSKWNETESDDTIRDVWIKRFEDAAKAIEISDPSNARGTLPAFAERMLKELRKPQIDWRTILNDFVQEEVNDYSFSPPDRRFDDSPFFLPDFNEKDETAKDILFMIDTSGSMSDEMITAAYSEVKGAIDQFNGKLQGWLGFFDAAIIKPEPFEDEESFEIIRPAGGGGTDFYIIFEYIKAYMSDQLPVSIIILTDGHAPYPDEEIAMDIPVLWLLNNEKITPPWGKIARIKV